MHDLHTADKIIKIALEQGLKNKLKKITKIVVELGSIVEHGEEINSANLKFNLKLLSKGTIAENSEIKIGKIKGASWNLKEIEGE